MSEDKLFSGWSRKSEENWKAAFGSKEPEPLTFLEWANENGIHLVDCQREYIKKIESGELTLQGLPYSSKT